MNLIVNERFTFATIFFMLMSMDLRMYDSNQRMYNSFFDESGEMLPWVRDFEALVIYEQMRKSHQHMIELLRCSDFQTIVNEYNRDEEWFKTCKFITYLTAYCQIKDIHDYIPRQ